MFFDSSLARFLDFLAFPAHHSSCLPVRLPACASFVWRFRKPTKSKRGASPPLVDATPDRFFVPPYVGPSGWVGVWLDGKVDWSELAGLLQDGYRMTAPKKLLALLKD